MSPRRIRVAVVFGGRSTEHAISCVSAGNILAALDPDEFEAVPVGITRAGQWVLTSGDPGQLAISGRRLPEVTAGSGTAVVLSNDPAARGLVVLDPAEGAGALGDVDVVFPALHGAYGEDGTIQGLLELAGSPDASLLAEIRVVRDHEFYDFEAKYLDDACEFDIPANLPEQVTRQIQDYARRTFTALDCAGLARVDFFVTDDFEVYLNEINTM